MGDKEPVEEDDEVVSYAEPSRGIYKKLIVRDDRLVGAIVIGDGAHRAVLLQAFARVDGRCPTTAPSCCSRVAATAAASAEADSGHRADLQLQRRDEGADHRSGAAGRAQRLQAVCDATRACTGCGSCRPEVQAIVEFAVPGARRRRKCWRPARTPSSCRTLVVPADGARRRHAEQDRALQEREGRPRHRRRRAAARAGRLGGDRRRRPRAAEMGGRVLPPSDARPLHDARPHVERPHQRRAAADARARSAREFGAGFADITTRQQMQLRGFGIEHVPEIWQRLEAVGLVSLQTGMDNIRNVDRLSGRRPDAARAVRRLAGRARVHRHVPAQQGVHEPAAEVQRRHHRLHRALHARRVAGPGADAGGQDDRRRARSRASTCWSAARWDRAATASPSPLDVFVRPEEAAELCAHDHADLPRPRLARGAQPGAAGVSDRRVGRRADSGAELQRRVGPAAAHGRHATRAAAQHADHLGVIGAEAGRASTTSAWPCRSAGSPPSSCSTLARLAETLRQRRHPPDDEPERHRPQRAGRRAAGARPTSRCSANCRHDPPGVIRGLVSCTGIDYCHFALIETKELALKTARHLEQRAAGRQAADHALVGMSGRLRQSRGRGHRAARQERPRSTARSSTPSTCSSAGSRVPNARPGTKMLEDVPVRRAAAGARAADSVLVGEAVELP